MVCPARPYHERGQLAAIPSMESSAASLDGSHARGADAQRPLATSSCRPPRRVFFRVVIFLGPAFASPQPAARYLPIIQEALGSLMSSASCRIGPARFDCSIYPLRPLPGCLARFCTADETCQTGSRQLRQRNKWTSSSGKEDATWSSRDQKQLWRNAGDLAGPRHCLPFARLLQGGQHGVICCSGPGPKATKWRCSPTDSGFLLDRPVIRRRRCKFGSSSDLLVWEKHAEGR